MSDDPKRPRRKWMSRVLAAVVVLVSYQATHYATAEYDWAVVTDAAGSQSAVPVHKEHRMIHGKPVPQWLESFLRPAYRIDELIGNPFGPEGRVCILNRPRKP
jgi:hypothetical protein